MLTYKYLVDPTYRNEYQYIWRKAHSPRKMLLYLPILVFLTTNIINYLILELCMYVYLYAYMGVYVCFFHLFRLLCCGDHIISYLFMIFTSVCAVTSGENHNKRSNRKRRKARSVAIARILEIPQIAVHEISIVFPQVYESTIACNRS